KHRGTKAMPVGGHPIGASPYGVQDMVDNVQEWTSTTYEIYSYQTHDGKGNFDPETKKVMRGGAGSRIREIATVADRFRFESSRAYDTLGVRLVLESGTAETDGISSPNLPF